MNAPIPRLTFSLMIGAGALLCMAGPAAAQAEEKPAATPPAAKSVLPRTKAPKDGDKSRASPARDAKSAPTGGASPMDAFKSSATAPKTGSMPLGGTPVSKGPIGTETAAKGKLGTPADPNSTDRPPRPN